VGGDPSPEQIAITKRSLERGMSHGHEHPSQTAREDHQNVPGKRVDVCGTTSRPNSQQGSP
jgi:hypothetical protein